MPVEDLIISTESFLTIPGIFWATLHLLEESVIGASLISVGYSKLSSITSHYRIGDDDEFIYDDGRR